MSRSGSAMSKHYTIREFFRQMPNAMLARYFEWRQHPHGLDLARVPEARPDPWLAVWDQVPERQRPEMEADFRDIYEMSCEKGALAFCDEVRFHLRDQPDLADAIIQKQAERESYYERAMVAFLDHIGYWRGATRFAHADALASTYRKRKGLPPKDAGVSEADIAELERQVSSYFWSNQSRGLHCKVEPYRRGQRDYFFAYVEDHSQRSAEFVEGAFGPRPHNPAFEIVFVYSKAGGELAISVKGERRTLQAMQDVFARAILKLDGLPSDPSDPRVYDLAPLAQKSFEFTYSPTTGIEQVVVKKMRLTSRAKRGDRITLEADASGDPKAIYTLLDTLGRSVQLGMYYVSQVELSASVRQNPDKKAKRVNIRITYPNSCSLKYDELETPLHDMLEASGIEPQMPGHETDASGLQT